MKHGALEINNVLRGLKLM